MKKPDLASRVASEASLSKPAADSAVNAMFSTISDALANGEKVSIAGFGMFSTRSRAARQGRNPRTGESIAIAASTVPSFKARKGLRDAVSVTALMEPPMSGLMEPLTGADLGSRTG